MGIGGCSGSNRNQTLNHQGSEEYNNRDGGSHPERFGTRCTKLDNCESFYNRQSLRYSEETSKTLKKWKFGRISILLRPSALGRRISRPQERVLKNEVKASVHFPSLDMSWHAAEEFRKHVKKSNETSHNARNRCLRENNGDRDLIKDNMEMIFHDDMKIEQDVLPDYM